MKTHIQKYGIRLTDREREILNYIIGGMKTREIAEALSIAENTVSNHRRSLVKKKGVKSCKELV